MVAYLGALQIHQIIANLKKHADQIYEWNVVPVGEIVNKPIHFKQSFLLRERTRRYLWYSMPS